MRLLLFPAALSLAAFAHQTAAQSCDDLEEQLRVCRVQELSPTTPTPDAGFTCDGVLSSDGLTCCASGCGDVCGGEGCSERGGGLSADDCCVSSSTERDAPLCSVAGKAPCVMDGVHGGYGTVGLENVAVPPIPETERLASVGDGDGWVPKLGDRWQYNLNPPVDTDVDADVFFIDTIGEAQTTIDELHSKGKWVSCYISTGTVEAWRDDADAFPSEAVGNSWDGWSGEKYLDITQQSVRDIMQARIGKAASMNCDAIEPDNMSNWNQRNTGLTISREEQVEYNRWFADTVHVNGMKIGMKNAIELLDDLSGYYDFAINEECHPWKECSAYSIPFVYEGKPVFNVEYEMESGWCDESAALGIDTIFKEYDLNPALCSCADPSRDLDCSDVTR